jgi:hypothetical protein
MTSTTPATSEAPRTDAAPIDWANVAVETTVMLRLQEAPPVAAARGKLRKPAWSEPQQQGRIDRQQQADRSQLARVRIPLA